PKLVTPPTVDNPPAKGKSKVFVIVIIIVLILVVAAGAYLFLTRKSSPVAMNTQHTMTKTTTVTTAPSPEITPVTEANVDQTLSNTDTTMQTAMNQANADLNSVSQIDSTQDNTTGL
ncbi:MAG: hypothetical protein KGJ07_10290, partial [Patescibacteria group bacterium]|nr:hypothetical protein [Patescibacteria group bacterium]